MNCDTTPCAPDGDGCLRCDRSFTPISGQPSRAMLEARIRELEGALCVIEGQAERIVEGKKTRAEILAEVVRVLGVAPA